jgi:hypothetical protein
MPFFGSPQDRLGKTAAQIYVATFWRESIVRFFH